MPGGDRLSIFDLLFLFVFLVSAVTLLACAVFAARGQRGRAAKILRIYALGAASYLLTGLLVSFLTPQRIIPIGSPWCFDDWCLTAEAVRVTPSASNNSYDVALRISSRARRVTQRAKGAWVYLIDEHGRRYSPEADPSALPLDLALAPGQSVTTHRVFRLPAEARQVGLVTGHGGPYCGAMDFLIIGSASCLFGRPTMIRVAP